MSIKDMFAIRKDVIVAKNMQAKVDLTQRNLDVERKSRTAIKEMMGDTYEELCPYLAALGHEENAGEWTCVMYALASDDLEIAPIHITYVRTGSIRAEVFDKNRQHWSNLESTGAWADVLFYAHLAYLGYVTARENECQRKAEAQENERLRKEAEAIHQAESARRKAEYEASEAEYLDAIRAWWAVAKPIQEANIATLDAYAIDLDQPYTVTRIHYGVVSVDDGVVAASSESVDTLGKVGEQWLCIVGSEVVKRTYRHLVAIDEPVARRPSDSAADYERCSVTIWGNSPYVHHNMSFRLDARPGTNPDDVRQEATRRMIALPPKPDRPKNIPAYEVQNLFAKVTGKNADDDMPF